jgi:tetratricopeptide (TPR) repeat protein
MACARTIRGVGIAVGFVRHAWRRARPARAPARALALLLAMLSLGIAPLAAAPRAKPVHATLTVTTTDGYARLLFSANEYIDASAKVESHILIIRFKEPIDVAVDRLPELAPEYIGTARRDPDGTAIRVALTADIAVNTMGAGEKVFVDLLPPNWNGPPPPMPMDVVNELAKRARDAELKLQRERQLTQAKYTAPIRVHVASLPTFTRYVFDVTGETGVAADRSKDRLVLNFSAPLTFDLADAQAALPAGVQAIDSELETDSALVRFVFGGSIDLRTFRDESGYVVDIVKPDGPVAVAPQPVPAAKSGNEGTPSPEAAAAAIHAIAAGGGPNSAAPPKPQVEGKPPRRGDQSSAAPNATNPNMAAAMPAAAPMAAPAGAQLAQAQPQLQPQVQPLSPQPSNPPLKVAQPAMPPIAPSAPPPAPAKLAAQSSSAQPQPQAPVPAAPAPAQQVAQAPMPVAPAPQPVTAPQTAAPPPAALQPAPPAMSQAAAVQATPAQPAPVQASPAQVASAPAASASPAPPQATPVSAPQPAPAAAASAASEPQPAAPANPVQTANAMTQAALPAVAPAPPTPPQPAPPVAAASPGPEPQSAAPANAQAAALAPAEKPAEAAPPRAAAPSRNIAPGALAVELTRDGNNLKLSFPFKSAVPSAVFHRADTLWLVFDSNVNMDLSALDNEPSRTIRGYSLNRDYDSDVVRLKLDRPHLASITTEGAVWTIEIGDSVLEPPRALEVNRNILGPNRSNVSIGFDEPQHVHRFTDPDIGDKLVVVTGFLPERGFINGQNFIEFHILASTQGIVVAPLADDVTVNLAADKVVIDRPSGLTLSPALQTLLHGRSARGVTFDSQIWGSDRQGSFVDRQASLINAAAQAPETKRMNPRLNLARFYLARDMYPEAKGVLDVALSADKQASENGSAIVLRAIAEVMMDRPEEALRDLADPAVGDQHDAPLWRALAYSLEGQWARARQGFKSVEAAVATLPVELQRVALMDEMRSAIEVGDFDGASADLNDFQTIGVPHELQPTLAVLMGRLDEGLGRTEDALSAYRLAADSWDRPAAAQGRLRETLLEFSLGDVKRDDVVTQLESLTTVWRGDETEIEALKVLAHLYTEDGRYRDAFYVMRSAMASHPNSAMTRQIQDEAAATFDALFLTAKGDAMPPVDALALFYDFRELTPVGGRGDEMIRRLADRLVAVDLLDQAAELLQYQVDHRLQGAARAQIATRLAVIYLMNKKADRALAVLRGTRSANVSDELRSQRLLLEGRALSDTGRPDLALEVIANLDGREVTRLRSDILWSAKRWDESAEQIELMYGDRYKDFAPLSDIEQQDILRAEIGYALSSDALGLARFREKYAAKMADTPDARVFERVSTPLGSSGDQFAAIAHAATSIDTLDGFLREMRARYPDSGATSPAAPMTSAPTSSAGARGSTAALPRRGSGSAQGDAQGNAQPPQAPPSAPALPPRRPAGNSVQNVPNTKAPAAPTPKKVAAALTGSASKTGGRAAHSFTTAALDNHVP